MALRTTTPAAAVAALDAPIAPTVAAPRRRRSTVSGLWALSAGALLLALHWVIPIGPYTAEGLARSFTSPLTVLVKEFLLDEGGWVVLLFGVIALADMLAAAGAGRSAQVARILTVTAVAGALTGVGLPTIALPGLGNLYMSGHHEAGFVISAFSPGGVGYGPYVQVELFVMLALAAAGSIAMGVAGWRTRAIPRWCSVVYGVGFFLNWTDAPVVAWVGLVLLLVSGAAIARSVRPGVPGVAIRDETHGNSASA